MLSVTIELPDSLLLKWDGSKERIRKETQKLLAIKLFEEGFLTTGQSAEMCGMNRIDFISEISRMGIPVVKMDTEEIEEEIASGRKL